jgi:hypothetical protein
VLKLTGEWCLVSSSSSFYANKGKGEVSNFVGVYTRQDKLYFLMKTLKLPKSEIFVLLFFHHESLSGCRRPSDWTRTFFSLNIWG